MTLSVFNRSKRHRLTVPVYLAFLLFFISLFHGAFAQENAIDLTVSPNTTVASSFLVAPGYLVTAYHAVRDKQVIYISKSRNDVFSVGKVVGFSEELDLALIQADVSGTPVTIGQWRSFPIGAETFVIGYPKIGNYVSDKRITGGLFNGYQDFSGREDWFQLSAEIHRGNSGSPVIGSDGTVYGVISHKLDAGKVVREYGDFPQNVNFALKSSELIKFLDVYGVDFKVTSFDASSQSRAFEIYQRHEDSIFLLLASASSSTSTSTD